MEQKCKQNFLKIPSEILEARSKQSQAQQLASEIFSIADQNSPLMPFA